MLVLFLNFFSFKVGSSPFKKVGFLYVNESLLKMMNNPFHFTIKALFVLTILLHFCIDIFGYVGKRLDKKAKGNFKIYGVTHWNINHFNKPYARYLKKGS